MTDETECEHHTGPWILAQMLAPIRYSDEIALIRCPESDFCLRGAHVIAGRIAFHFRNVPGSCPWVNLAVAATAPSCGCEPYITTRQLRIVLRADGHPGGPIRAIKCPGGCRDLVPVSAGRIAAHRGGRCLWSSVRIIDRGWYPSLLTPE